MPSSCDAACVVCCCVAGRCQLPPHTLSVVLRLRMHISLAFFLNALVAGALVAGALLGWADGGRDQGCQGCQPALVPASGLIGPSTADKHRSAAGMLAGMLRAGRYVACWQVCCMLTRCVES